MGTGKSSASITYINEHPERRFIYITPYLEEAARIKKGCPDMHFVEPSDKLKKYEFKKSTHTAALIKEGRNITTTHQAFRGYTAEMLDSIREMGYTLIIDENCEVLESFPIHPDDIQLAEDAGYIQENDGAYSILKEDYHGTALHELFYMMKSRDLFHINDKGNNILYFWALPPDLITSFDDVFILTYLFKGQSLHHFLEMYGIPYEYIGIHKDEEGVYRFGDLPGYVPEYVSKIHDYLHILDNSKMNNIGDDYHALSMSWFERGGDNLEKLKNNVRNCYRNLWYDIPADRRLWGSYKGAFNVIKGKGYAKGFVTFNARATNKYRDRDALVYISNVFMNVSEKTFYEMHGVEVDEDLYALSVLVQWVWRSAIRDGKEVRLYIPSRRMRKLLEDWLDSLSEGGEANA